MVGGEAHTYTHTTIPVCSSNNDNSKISAIRDLNGNRLGYIECSAESVYTVQEMGDHGKIMRQKTQLRNGIYKEMYWMYCVCTSKLYILTSQISSHSFFPLYSISHSKIHVLTIIAQSLHTQLLLFQIRSKCVLLSLFQTASSSVGCYIHIYAIE